MLERIARNAHIFVAGHRGLVVEVGKLGRVIYDGASIRFAMPAAFGDLEDDDDERVDGCRRLGLPGFRRGKS